MASDDDVRSRLEQMIDLKHLPAVLGTRLPWAAIEAAAAPKLAHQAKLAKRVVGEDLTGALAGEFRGGISPAGRPRSPVRLMGPRTWSGSSSAAWATTKRACRARTLLLGAG